MAVNRTRFQGVPLRNGEATPAEVDELRGRPSAPGPRVEEPVSEPSVLRVNMFERVKEPDVGFQLVPGGVLQRDPKPTDFFQGEIGDCGIVATLAGYARAKPAVLNDAVTRLADGNYSVRFFNRDPTFGVTAEYVTVTPTVPVNESGVATRAVHTPQGRLMAAIIEKAYAKLRGGYSMIGNGNVPNHLAFALTGRDGDIKLLALKSSDTVEKDLSQALAKGRVVTVASLPRQMLPKSGDGAAVLGAHVYTVTSVSETNGDHFVELRNPAGDWWERPGASDPVRVWAGVTRMSLADFLAAFPVAFITD